jgi:hypothetical protein
VRRNADGEYTEYAEDSDSDPEESHHGGLDVGKLLKVVSRIHANT